MRVGGWVIKRLCAGPAGSFGRPRSATTRACQRGGDGRRETLSKRSGEREPSVRCPSARALRGATHPARRLGGGSRRPVGLARGREERGKKIRPAGVCARSRGRCCGLPVNAHARRGSGTSPALTHCEQARRRRLQDRRKREREHDAGTFASSGGARSHPGGRGFF